MQEQNNREVQWACPFMGLPIEIIFLISFYLKYKDLLALGMTTRGLYALTNNDQYWKYKAEEYFPDSYPALEDNTQPLEWKEKTLTRIMASKIYALTFFIQEEFTKTLEHTLKKGYTKDDYNSIINLPNEQTSIFYNALSNLKNQKYLDAIYFKLIFLHCPINPMYFYLWAIVLNQRHYINNLTAKNFNFYQQNNFLLLDVAIAFGRNEIIEILLEYGLSFSSFSSTKYSSLTTAVNSGHIETVKLLLRHNADDNSTKESLVPLAKRIAHKDISALLMLCDYIKTHQSAHHSHSFYAEPHPCLQAAKLLREAILNNKEVLNPDVFNNSPLPLLYILKNLCKYMKGPAIDQLNKTLSFKNNLIEHQKETPCVNNYTPGASI